MEPVAIQTHLDMVCEKEAGVTHNFATDPIRPRRVGNRILASGTTLGADNGIGVAASLALLTTPAIRHGPLELLFTVQEEIGLRGAAALDPSLLRSRKLINLDTEDQDVLTIGSAGAANACLSLDTPHEAVDAEWAGQHVQIIGLKGGHSGLDIHRRRGNAIKLLGDVLTTVQSAGIDFRIACLRGGANASAIPRECGAVLALHPLSAARFDELLTSEESRLSDTWKTEEPSIQLKSLPAIVPEEAWPIPFGRSILGLIRNLPDGLLKLSAEFPGSTETSANVGKIRSDTHKLAIVTGIRSLAESQIDELLASVSQQGRKLGAAMNIEERYPAWLPNRNSELLRLADLVFRDVNRRSPVLCPLHGGLECSLVAQKIPDIDAISFGPLIQLAHTPQENVDVVSVGAMWRMLVALLDALNTA
jgi:dipeptidase D